MNPVKLEVDLSDEHDYKVAADAFPVVGKLIASSEACIASKIDLTELYLESRNNSDICFGSSFSGRIGSFNDTINLRAGEPYVLNYNIAEYDGLDELVPGSYRVLLKVVIYLKNGDGEFKAHELSAEKNFEL